MVGDRRAGGPRADPVNIQIVNFVVGRGRRLFIIGAQFVLNNFTAASYETKFAPPASAWSKRRAGRSDPRPVRRRPTPADLSRANGDVPCDWSRGSAWPLARSASLAADRRSALDPLEASALHG